MVRALGVVLLEKARSCCFNLRHALSPHLRLLSDCCGRRRLACRSRHAMDSLGGVELRDHQHWLITHTSDAALLARSHPLSFLSIILDQLKFCHQMTASCCRTSREPHAARYERTLHSAGRRPQRRRAPWQGGTKTLKTQTDAWRG